mmetsp:Transcript_11739/g.24791  ORF Transcript_11739/g.24791 Transcript_11739/m.24791 type:complete len:111 (-) Transcript_11739:413-745(-)
MNWQIEDCVVGKGTYIDACSDCGGSESPLHVLPRHRHRQNQHGIPSHPIALVWHSPTTNGNSSDSSSSGHNSTSSFAALHCRAEPTATSNTMVECNSDIRDAIPLGPPGG